MRLNEWNARLHGLVVFRSLLDDAVVAKLVDLTDRMASGTPGCSAVCDAVAQFEAALFEHLVSSAPVGSSARMISGLFTMARAIATRCICPPDISLGFFLS